MKNLFQKKAFWGILLLALVAVTAIAASVIILNAPEDPIVGLDGPGNAVAEITTAPLPTEEPETEGEKPVSSLTVPETTTPKETQEQTKTAEAANPVSALHFSSDSKLLWPIDGRVLLEYNMENTIYFPTLDEYKCNPAVVIQADKGMEVKAACAGVVSEIGSNEEIGNYVTLNIGDNYTLTYGQLEEINLRAGQAVESGAVIGTIGEPTAYYTKEGYNLYLELKENEKAVDPLDHLDYDTEN